MNKHMIYNGSLTINQQLIVDDCWVIYYMLVNDIDG